MITFGTNWLSRVAKTTNSQSLTTLTFTMSRIESITTSTESLIRQVLVILKENNSMTEPKIK